MSAKMHKVLVGQIMCREFFLQILMLRNFSLGPHSPVSDFSYETWKVVITQNLHELRLGSPLGGSIIFSLKKIPNNTSRDFCCRKMNGREMLLERNVCNF